MYEETFENFKFEITEAVDDFDTLVEWQSYAIGVSDTIRLTNMTFDQLMEIEELLDKCTNCFIY